MYYNNPDVRYVGLFAYTNENSVIRNIGIVDSYFYATGNVGAIAGSSRGEITNCYNKSTISGTNNNIGGIAGCMEYGSIIDCYNTGSVSAEKSNYVGGIVGYVNLSSPKMICNCYNTGNISGVFQVGGIVGYSVNYNTTDNITIENCYNTGNIYGRSYTDFYDYTKFPSHIGGIAGSTSGRIINCYNVGSITCDEGATNVGGILGTAYHRAMVVIDNCYSVKDFNCPEDVTFDVICGDKNEAIITNCYEKSYEQFASGEVAYLLQGEQTEQIWGQDINNGESVQKHPTFTGAKVYQITNCKNETIYSNTNENIDHNYENGICTGCGGTDPSIVNISIVGDITLKLEKTGDNIFTGDISLDAGTYQFWVAHNNVLLGFNGTYTDTATINYTVRDIKSTIFNVTGGKYTFTYNASTKNLVIDYIPPQVLGDVNWDSTIDIRDVIFVMQHIVGTITFDENQSFYADMDSDGIVSVMDVLYLQKMLLGMV